MRVWMNVYMGVCMKTYMYVCKVFIFQKSINIIAHINIKEADSFWENKSRHVE